MESNLTELEIGAVLQLIQLSRGGDDLRVLWVNFPAADEESNKQEGTSEEASSSTFIASENPAADESEALPRRKERFGSVVDIYRKTRPLIKKNRAKKRARF